jgi:hypothetical protein
MQNKPNSCPYADREIGVPGRANVQNEPNLAQPHAKPRPLEANDAKQSQFRSARRKAGPPGRIVRNEPNLRRSDGKGKPFMGRELW